MSNSKPLVIYHANCMDGFSGAWCFHNFYGPDNVEFHAASYGQPAPDVTGREVFLVDFSYPREVLEQLVATASKVVLIDHHKTAFDAVGDGIPGLHTFMLDNRSGCMLAWEYLWQGVSPAPEILWYVQDRDLWLFAMIDSHKVNAYIQSLDQSFDQWDKLMRLTHVDLPSIASQGEGILRQRKKHVAEMARQHRLGNIFGYQDIPVCNCPGMFASDVGHELCKDKPFSLTYSDGSEKTYFSLRSSQTGVDVEQLAKRMGGGGHVHAAGFTIAYDDHEAWTAFADVFTI